MTKKFVFATLVVAALIALAVGPIAEGSAPEGAAPAASTPADLYAKKCAMCHGKDGVAKPMAAGSANLNDKAWQKAATVDAIVKVTTEGKDKMPKFEGKMTPDEMKGVADYILKLP